MFLLRSKFVLFGLLVIGCLFGFSGLWASRRTTSSLGYSERDSREEPSNATRSITLNWWNGYVSVHVMTTTTDLELQPRTRQYNTVIFRWRSSVHQDREKGRSILHRSIELTSDFCLAIALVMISPPLLVLTRRLTAYYRRHRQCMKCSYDLSGNTSGICPECGEPVPSKH